MANKGATSYAPLPNSFDGNGDWTIYEEKTKQHFEAYRITDDNQKRAMLLASLPEEVFDTLTALCFPEKAETKTFKDVCAVMESHFTPVVAVYRERRQFYDTKQRSSESVNEFVARLKQASRHCKFEGNYTNILRDVFVCGLHGGSVRNKVFEMKPTSTFEECLQVALTTEAIKAIDDSEDD